MLCDLEKAQEISGLLVAPAVAGHDGKAQHADPGVGDQRNDALDVGAGGAEEIIILDEESLFGDGGHGPEKEGKEAVLF
jgi:hypothetical protein